MYEEEELAEAATVIVGMMHGFADKMIEKKVPEKIAELYKKIFDALKAQGVKRIDALGQPLCRSGVAFQRPLCVLGAAASDGVVPPGTPPRVSVL